ncbi:hypothetical protein EW026_g8040 [Hermanssonia centrifuga]|uniref:Cupin type-1 domain-containing protein n=1 Tax=Hermanssonia centrifuga TaxID=98765 RepID=A0A4V3X970_9APHY|nr:hypothetical protein EW026_g8040 [Hermanssonia centrifuga]
MLAPFVVLAAAVVSACALSTTGIISNHTAPPASQNFFEATAIVPDIHGNSALECWRLSTAFTASTGAGTVGASTMNINDLANATYTVLPPRFEGGVHNSPHPQLVVFLSGVVHVTLPHGTGDAWVVGGIDGLIFAVDSVGTGHNTSYPSNSETRALQIPFTDGVIPPHTVVNSGACLINSQIVTV